jgi:hypothetical protein
MGHGGAGISAMSRPVRFNGPEAQDEKQAANLTRDTNLAFRLRRRRERHACCAQARRPLRHAIEQSCGMFHYYGLNLVSMEVAMIAFKRVKRGGRAA